jgi:hypothetical protein
MSNITEAIQSTIVPKADICEVIEYLATQEGRYIDNDFLREVRNEIYSFDTYEMEPDCIWAIRDEGYTTKAYSIKCPNRIPNLFTLKSINPTYYEFEKKDRLVLQEIEYMQNMLDEIESMKNKIRLGLEDLGLDVVKVMKKIGLTT